MKSELSIPPIGKRRFFWNRFVAIVRWFGSAFARRIYISIGVLIVVSAVSFSVMKLAPGDPASFLIDPQTKPEARAQFRKDWGLDQPIPVQYGKWLNQAVHGNLGYSLISHQPVAQAIKDRLPATLLLMGVSFSLIILISLPLGVWSGARKGSKFDRITMLTSFIGFSIPTFWLGLVLILIFSVKLNWFPTSGMQDPMLVDATLPERFGDVAKHMVLPVLTIVCGGLAGLTRYHRFGTIQVLSQEYILAARARGIPEWRILFVHALKNAALPLITILGIQLPSLVGGSFVIESIFGWPGLGQLGISAVFARDYPILMGILMMSSILIVIGNLSADFCYGKVDPRIRTRL